MRSASPATSTGPSPSALGQMPLQTEDGLPMSPIHWYYGGQKTAIENHSMLLRQLLCRITKMTINSGL